MKVKSALLRVGAVAIVFLLGACTSEGSAKDPGEAPSESVSEDLPTLLRWDRTASDVGYDARVVGPLGLNDAGCFVVGDAILVAPPEAEVLADGDGLSIPDVGEIRVGETLEGRGGYSNVAGKGTRDDVTRCQSSSAPESTYVTVDLPV
jgi:hypothetical protein